MFSFSFFDTPKLTLTGLFYTLEYRGITDIMTLIAKTFGTRFQKNVLKQLSYRRAVFHKFFVMELYCLIMETRDDLLQKAVRSTMVKPEDLEKLGAFLKENSWLKETDHDPAAGFLNATLPAMERGITPFPYQVGFYKLYSKDLIRYNLTGTILAARAGTGKTLSSLLVAKGLPDDFDVIVVSPNNAQFTVWDKTITEQFGAPPHIVARDGTDITTHGIMSDGRQIFVVHMEALKTIGVIGHHITSGRKRRFFLIVDECHNFNDPNSERTKQLVTFADTYRGKWVALPMSGTPLKAFGKECYAAMVLCDPLFVGSVRQDFLKIYSASCLAALDILAHRLGIVTFVLANDQGYNKDAYIKKVPVKVPDSKRYLLATVTADLRAYMEARLRHYMEQMPSYFEFFKKTMSDFIQKQSDPKIISDYKVYMSYVYDMHTKGFDRRTMAPMSAFCKNFEKNHILPSLPGGLRSDFRKAVSVVKYVAMVCQGEALGNLFTKRRIECFADIVKHMDLPKYIAGAEKKVLFFSDYVDVIKTMCAIAEEAGYTTQLVFADTNKNLPAIMKDFHETERVKVIGATYDSLSTAQPVVAANVTVMANYPYRKADFDQTVARTNREGQTHTVRVYIGSLDTGEEPNISERAEDIMTFCQEMVDIMTSRAKVVSGDVETMMLADPSSVAHQKGFRNFMNVIEDLTMDDQE